MYADFELGGVTQRMRWVPAGRFVMGSPPEERERKATGALTETQHEVSLSEGYWLADTACTQALWVVVGGKNPSGFEGRDRPVEQVSWDDCAEFIRGCEALSPGLGLRLPTEAEWEYACRAGTETAFSFGPTITPEQVNYHGEYPYAGPSKGLNRKATVPVKSLPPNAWGLYEMHGNVWEWCSDWLGPYAPGRAIDPRGPAQGSSRVVRGGSWSDPASLARSARRVADEPADRFSSLGFRVARG